jgi:hypothetical protein
LKNKKYKKIGILIEQKVGITAEDELFFETSSKAQSAVGFPDRVEEVARDQFQSWSKLFKQARDTENQASAVETRTCLQKMDSKLLLLPAVGGAGFVTIRNISNWANSGDAKIAGPLEVIKNRFSKNSGVPNANADKMANLMDLDLDTELRKMGKEIDLSPEAKQKVRTNWKKGAFNGFLWSQAGSLIILGLMAPLDIGETNDSIFAPLRRTVEWLAVYDNAWKFAVMEPIALSGMTGLTDPCLLYSVAVFGAGWYASSKVAKFYKNRKGKAADTDAIQQQVVKQTHKETLELGGKVEQSIQRVNNASKSRSPEVPEEAKEAYFEWLKSSASARNFQKQDGQDISILNKRLEEIYKRTNAETPTNKTLEQQLSEFRNWAIQHNKDVAKAATEVIDPYLKKASTIREKMTNAYRASSESVKSLLIFSRRFPELVGKIRNRKNKGNTDVDSLPSNTKEAAEVLKNNQPTWRGSKVADTLRDIRNGSFDTIEKIVNFEKYFKNANKRDPRGLFVAGQNNAKILDDLLEGAVDPKIKEDLVRALVEINSNKNLHGDILDKILKDLNVDPKSLNNAEIDLLSGLERRATHPDAVADIISMNLVERFYGKGTASPEQAAALREFCENIGKEAEKKGLGKIKTFAVSTAALGVVGYLTTDKKLAPGGYYFEGVGPISDLLNSAFGVTVVKVANKIHFKWAKSLSDDDLQEEIQTVLEGGILLSRRGKSVEEIVNDKNEKPYDKNNNMQLKGFFNKLLKGEYSDSDEALNDFAEVRKVQLQKFSKSETIQKQAPELGNISDQILTYMANLYIYNTQMPGRLKTYIEKQNNNTLGSTRMKLRKLQEVFEYQISDSTQVLKQMNRLDKIEKRVEVKDYPGIFKNNNKQPKPDKPLPDLKIKTNTERQPGEINSVQEIKSLNLKELKEIVSQMINENTGQGYMDYPYHSETGHPDEEAGDFVQDWKNFELSLVRDKSRETAIRVAKILVKDLELFGDVIDLVGKNQSVATEILNSMKDVE